MLKIKFIVLVICFSNIFSCRTKYCNICPDHTLCKYDVPGPSEQCVGYDTNALLTDDDSKHILDKINERRNFIAIGHSKLLPEAANMKKIVWSEELATFAQRWVDQCDQTVRPDRKDQCRDLDNLEVGQNIATITGLSSRFNVKSFVETWFMESMDYTGSVTFYNQSRDHKTNDFTQLIWADTDKVGCGKAKFFVKNVKPMIVERIVCNFAPRGNIHGKPVYTIGYAATQCGNRMGPDKTFHGLCSHRMKPKGKLSATYPPTHSLLRIRNLFNNDSARQEIDPIYNNLKQMSKAINFAGDNRPRPEQMFNYQYINNDAVKRSYPFKNEMIWNSQQSNKSRYYGDYEQLHEKGHSRLYHGHGHGNEFDSFHPESMFNQRYDYRTTAPTYMEQDYRKHNIDRQCTRKSEMKQNNYDVTENLPCKQKINKCTRGQKIKCRQSNNCKMTMHKCEDQHYQTTPVTNPHEFCACNSFTICPSKPNHCGESTYCDCININCPTRPCPHMLRTLRDVSNKKFERHNYLQYYDILSNVAQEKRKKTTSEASASEASSKTRDIFLDFTPMPLSNEHLKSLERRKQLRNFSDRKRRVAEEEENFKPFWQMDEYMNRNQAMLKAIRYTTLPNKKSQKYKRTRKTTKSPIKTEPITVAYKERNKNEKRITEKYLSFEELMHLRRYNEGDTNARRYHDEKLILRSDDTTTQQQSTKAAEREAKESESTTEYTFNTPYVRLRHCTRKLTCTWTAASLTDSAGSIIPGGSGGGVGGSRTPPGYVEGCTRTSTCTRDYMNRNKMATIPIEATSPEADLGDDEDYCERRSLNRRSNDISINKNKSTYFFLNNNISLKESYSGTFNNCICYDEILRIKRHDYEHEKSINVSRKNVKRESIMNEKSFLSYGDLYYFVVRKFIDMWKNEKPSRFNEKCLCSGVNIVMCYNLLLFLTIFLI